MESEPEVKSISIVHVKGKKKHGCTKNNTEIQRSVCTIYIWKERKNKIQEWEKTCRNVLNYVIDLLMPTLKHNFC